MIGSMSRRGDCFDNALSESFFATYNNELIHLQPWPTRQAAIAATADFIDARYNLRRLHSTLSYRTPRRWNSSIVSSNWRQRDRPVRETGASPISRRGIDIAFVALTDVKTSCLQARPK